MAILLLNVNEFNQQLRYVVWKVSSGVVKACPSEGKFRGNLFCKRSEKKIFIDFVQKEKNLCEENPNLEREKSIRIDKTRIKLFQSKFVFPVEHIK